MSKHIGTYIRVKYTDDSPLSGTIMTFHIKNLEAEIVNCNKNSITEQIDSIQSIKENSVLFYSFWI